ncbi:MAG: EVE domain-containing protein, partial [Thermoprotei archaeon]
WRARLEPIKLGLADFEKLVPELTFIVKKERATVYLVGTPANLRRPIPVKDAKRLINSF